MFARLLRARTVGVISQRISLLGSRCRLSISGTGVSGDRAVHSHGNHLNDLVSLIRNLNIKQEILIESALVA